MFFLGIFFMHGVFGQNLILNPDFELGTDPTTMGNPNQIEQDATNWYNGCGHMGNPNFLGTPDIYVRQGSHFTQSLSIDANPATTSPNNRYAHILPTNKLHVAGINDYGESIKATVSSPFSSNFGYDVSCYIACPYVEPGTSYTVKNHQIQFVLRKGNDCTIEKVVYTSPSITPDVQYVSNYYVSNAWHYISGLFSLTQSEVNIGYDRLEIRSIGGDSGSPVYIDDVNLHAVPLSTASFVFKNVGQTVVNENTYYGIIPVTQICETPPKTCVFIDASASTNANRFWIAITPWDLGNWTPTGAALYADWVCFGCTSANFTNKNLCDLIDIPNNGSGLPFEPGKVYKVSVNFGPIWDSNPSHTDHFIRINALPIINAGPNQSICANSNPTFNITNTSGLPVKVYNSTLGTYIGTYSLSSITLPKPTANTTYKFVATNSSGCSASDWVDVTLIPIPKTTISGGTTFCQNNPLTFTGTLTSGVCLKYFWQIQQCDINGNNLYGTEYSSHWIYGNPNTFTYTTASTPNIPIPTGGLPCGQYYRVKLVTLSAETDGCWNYTYKVIRIDCCSSIGLATNDNLLSKEKISQNEKSMGIETIDDLTNSISISPNPTNGKFNIDLNGVASEKVVVYNMLGKVVAETIVTENARSLDIDLTELPASIYMIHVHTGGEVILKKVIKN